MEINMLCPIGAYYLGRKTTRKGLALTTPNYHNVRDDAGKFAPVSANGGGSNFGGEGFEYPETRDVLLKGATSRPSTAPTMTGGNYEAPPAFDAKAAIGEVTPDRGEPPSTDSWSKLQESEAAPEDEFATAHRAMGYTPAEHAGMARPDLSEHLGTAMPPPNMANPGHPFPRSALSSMASHPANGVGTPPSTESSEPDFGGADTSIGGNGNGGQEF